MSASSFMHTAIQEPSIRLLPRTTVSFRLSQRLLALTALKPPDRIYGVSSKETSVQTVVL